MIMSFATALTKELDIYTPCILEKGKTEQRKVHRRLLFLIEKILRVTKETFSNTQQEKLIEALKYSAKKHQGIYRKDKITPYFLHPLEVVLIILDLNILDFKIIIASILHDVVEDTDTSLKDISKLFGSGVRNIVDLMTKQKKETNKETYWIRIKRETDLNCKWRTIVLKYADRIHYFMTSSSVPEENKKRHVDETLLEFPKLHTELKCTLSRLHQRGTLKNKKRIDEIVLGVQKKLTHEMHIHT